MIALRAASDTATVVAELGGRVGSLTASGTELLVTGGADTNWMQWGSYPMAPWAGRLRDGRFTHDGITHQLAVNLPPHAIHGTVANRPWTVVDADERTASLTCDLGDAWPLGGTAHQRVELVPGELRCTLAVTAADRSMPATIGWHPWFRSPGPVEIDATAMYERGDDGLPTGRVLSPRPRPWDDCFLTTEPARFAVEGLVVTVTSDCDHLVVFDELDRGVAVEPQSGPPDEANRADWFAPSAPAHPRVLGPGETLRRTMTISWRGAIPTRG